MKYPGTVSAYIEVHAIHGIYCFRTNNRNINPHATEFIPKVDNEKEIIMTAKKTKRTTNRKASSATKNKEKTPENITEEVEGKKKKKKKSFDEETFYTKYPHVVRGSIKEAERGSVPADTGVQTHGRICIIACEDCGKERIINIQDAFQTRYCIEHQKSRARARAKEKRQAKRLDEL